MSDIPSIELWAAAKYIGRECSAINKAYLECKSSTGNPFAAAEKGDQVISCSDNVVHTLKTQYPVQFSAFAKCLNKNDYQYEKCRRLEENLKACWNNDHQQKQLSSV